MPLARSANRNELPRDPLIQSSGVHVRRHNTRLLLLQCEVECRPRPGVVQQCAIKVARKLSRDNVANFSRRADHSRDGLAQRNCQRRAVAGVEDNQFNLRVSKIAF